MCDKQTHATFLACNIRVFLLNIFIGGVRFIHRIPLLDIVVALNTKKG